MRGVGLVGCALLATLSGAACGARTALDAPTLAVDGGAGVAPVCLAPETICDGLCLSLASDPHNCGGCGRDCLGGSCVSGLCQPVLFGQQWHVDDLAVDADNVYVLGQAVEGGLQLLFATAKFGAARELARPEGAVAVVSDGEIVYFSEPGAQRVRAVPKGGGTVVDVATQIDGASLLAVDAKDLYVTTARGAAEIASVDHALRVVADFGTAPTALAIDPQGALYFVESDRLFTAPRDGSGGAVGGFTLGAATRLVVNGGELFFLVPGSAVGSLPVAQGMVSVAAAPASTDLAVDDHAVYLATNDATRGRILRSGRDLLAPVAIANLDGPVVRLVDDPTSLYFVVESVGGTGAVLYRLAK